MQEFRRYAIYDLGPDPLARFGAAWLGWDAIAGVPMPPVGGEAITAVPSGSPGAEPWRYQPPTELSSGSSIAPSSVTPTETTLSVAPMAG